MLSTGNHVLDLVHAYNTCSKIFFVVSSDLKYFSLFRQMRMTVVSLVIYIDTCLN